MASVTVNKLLKHKNRLVSEINRLKRAINEHNVTVYSASTVSNNLETFDMDEAERRLSDLTERLVKVKSTISKANINAFEKINQLSEIKSLISFYENIECKPNLYRHQNPDYPDTVVVLIKPLDREETVSMLIKRANNLQDELDSYNFLTKVEVEENLLAE